MPNKEFSFGFVLSAAMNSNFATGFKQASQRVEQLRLQMGTLTAAKQNS